jgi:hypothetical protein
MAINFNPLKPGDTVRLNSPGSSGCFEFEYLGIAYPCGEILTTPGTKFVTRRVSTGVLYSMTREYFAETYDNTPAPPVKGETWKRHDGFVNWSIDEVTEAFVVYSNDGHPHVQPLDVFLADFEKVT